MTRIKRTLSEREGQLYEEDRLEMGFQLRPDFMKDFEYLYESIMKKYPDSQIPDTFNRPGN